MAWQIKAETVNGLSSLMCFLTVFHQAFAILFLNVLIILRVIRNLLYMADFEGREVTASIHSSSLSPIPVQRCD